MYIHNCVFHMSVTLNISKDSALALQVLLHTADFKDAANQCTDYSQEMLHVLCGDVVVALHTALETTNA